MLLEHLPHTMTLKHKSHDNDELGGDEETLDAYANDVPCWVQPASRSQQWAMERRSMRADIVIYHTDAISGMEIDDDIFPADGEVACPYSGKRYIVKAFGESSVGLDICQEILCQEFVP